MLCIIFVVELSVEDSISPSDVVTIGDSPRQTGVCVGGWVGGCVFVNGCLWKILELTTQGEH